VDPIAHSLTGAALAAAGLRRATPLATAALMIGANAPDVDVVMSFAGDYASLAHRRGWTHGVLALVVLPFVVAGSLLAYDRFVRRRRGGVAPARAGPLLALAALAVLTHPTLDWLNNYGLRWLMPFDGRWFYGDALFIIDPWIWLVLGGVLFLAYSRTGPWVAAWAGFAALGSVLIFTTDEVPAVSRALWVAGIAVVVGLRAARLSAVTRPRLEQATRAALAACSAYMAIAVLVNVPARAEVRAALAAAGVDGIERIMIGPRPADPFAADVVAETRDAYYTGKWHWLASPRFAPSARPLEKGGEGPIAAAARATREAQRYLTWSRFPMYEIEPHADGYIVRIEDARYHGTGRLAGVVVRLDAKLEPVR
jgi:inner membrane protein